MGTWGVGLLQDDISIDVKDLFDKILAAGESVEMATSTVLRSRSWDLDDEDDYCVVYLTLALLQLSNRYILPDTQRVALDLMDSGQASNRWEDANIETQKARVEVLRKFKSCLERGEASLDDIQQIANPTSNSLW